MHLHWWYSRKEKKNQGWTNWCEIEPIDPTLLKNPLDASWGLLPTLRWVDVIQYKLQLIHKPLVEHKGYPIDLCAQYIL